MARPSVMTTNILERLRQAFAIGCSDEEAVAYAKIGISTLYDYQREHPEFSEEKEELKKAPILKAKNVVVKSLDDVNNAKWYLERKLKNEFSLRNEMTGADGKDIPTTLLVKFVNDGNTNTN